MTESEFEHQFDNGQLDCEYAIFISEHYDAWNKGAMLSYWDNPDAYDEFKARMLYKPVAKKQQYSLGPNPLDKFPSMWSKT
jgi:hypothetical protein